MRYPYQPGRRINVRSTWQSALLAAILTSSLAAPTSAQDSIDAVLGQLRPGQVVRVTTAGQGRVAARILEFETGPRLLRLEGIPSPVALGSIDSLWVRGRATKTGLIVGAAVGGVSAFALAATICSVASEGQGCDVWGTVAAIGLGGAAGGALLGAAVGSAIPKWRSRYARRRAPVGVGVTLNRGVGLSVSVPF